MYTQPRAGFLHPSTFMGVHFSPLLMFLIEIYRFAASPYTLLFIQSLALAAPAWYIYKIGIQADLKPKMALIFALIYLIYPGTLWSNWYDFHLEAFIPLFLSAAYFYYQRRNNVRMIGSLLLLMFTFERAVFLVIAFALYAVIRDPLLEKKTEKPLSNRTKLFLILMVVCAALYFIQSERIMYQAWPNRGVIEPTKIFGKITYDNLLLKVAFIALLSAPLAFLPLFSPLELLIASPYLLLAMTSDYTPYFTIPWQYPAIISIPFFLAAIEAAKKEQTTRIGVKVVAAGLTIFLLFSPGTPIMTQFSSNWAITLPDNETILKHAAISQIDQGSSVLAQENLFPNLTERKTAYTLWPKNAIPPDYIVVDIQSYYFYTEPVGNTTREQMLRLLNEYNYGIKAQVNGFFVLKLGYAGGKTMITPLKSQLDLVDARSPFVSQEDYFRETSFFVPDSVKVEDGHITIPKGLRGSVWWGPWLTLPPGEYRVTIILDADELGSLPLLTLESYWYKTITYDELMITGDSLTDGGPTTIVWEFTLDEWAPSLEVVGISHGWAEVRVYSLTLEEIS